MRREMRSLRQHYLEQVQRVFRTPLRNSQPFRPPLAGLVGSPAMKEIGPNPPRCQTRSSKVPLPRLGKHCAGCENGVRAVLGRAGKITRGAAEVCKNRSEWDAEKTN